MYRFALLTFLALLLVSSGASGQYMYLDSNGDGVHTSADVVAATGPTTFDIWLHTDQNRDGSPATCVTDDGELTINSYEFVLHTIGGLVTWSGFVNHQANFTVSFGLASSSTDYYPGLGGGTIHPAGLYRLASLTATRVAGTPSIQIVTAVVWMARNASPTPLLDSLSYWMLWPCVGLTIYSGLDYAWRCRHRWLR